MSAAHMLALRDFEVVVYDRNEKYVGGKARSVDVPGTNTSDPDKYLPGEHGFRFFPGFYRHIIETMEEIPLGPRRSAADSLVSTDTIQINQIGDCPIRVPLHFPRSFRDVFQLFDGLQEMSEELTRAEAEDFAWKIWQLMTSCRGRFRNEYERVGWWEYTGAEEHSEAYRRLLVDGLTRSLVASKARLASTRTVGTMFIQLLYTMVDGVGKNADRVLDLPTNEAWLCPWLDFLERNGVEYHKGHELVRVELESEEAGAAIRHAEVKTVADGETLPPVKADYYLFAMPVEVAARVIENSPGLLRADPKLEKVIRLAPNVEWMNGIQYFLSEPFEMHRGHTIYSGSNYALTSISQKQFWPNYDLESRFGGRAKGILSVDISDWDKPGNFNGKAAKDCTRDEVVEEVFLQLQQEINSCGDDERLSRDMLVFAYLDESIYQPFSNPTADEAAECIPVKGHEDKTICQLMEQQLENREPLLVNLIDTWELRPHAHTAVPNLTLASDYVRTNSDLACMEGANEAARRAVNSILKASGSHAPRLRIWKFRSPLPLYFYHGIDWIRWKLGVKWRPLLWPFVKRD